MTKEEFLNSESFTIPACDYLPYEYIFYQDYNVPKGSTKGELYRVNNSSEPDNPIPVFDINDLAFFVTLWERPTVMAYVAFSDCWIK